MAFSLLIDELMREIWCADIHLWLIICLVTYNHIQIHVQYLFTRISSIYGTRDLLSNPHQELKTFKHAAGRCIEEYFVTSNAEEAGSTSVDWFIILGGLILLYSLVVYWLLYILIAHEGDTHVITNLNFMKLDKAIFHGVLQCVSFMSPLNECGWKNE